MGQGRSFQLFRQSEVTRRHSDGADLKRFTLTSDLIDESKVYGPCNAFDQKKGNSLEKSFLNSHGPNDQEGIATSTYEKTIAASQAEVQKLRTENDRLLAISSANLKISENLKQDYERKIKSLEADVKRLEEEKHILFTRLSEISAVRLTEINPTIADLSDPNRPSQLVEQLSELYDSEWTDAFEYLCHVKGLENVTTVRKLLNILQIIYNVCLESRRKPTEQLHDAILSYLGLSDEDKDILVIKKTENILRGYRAKQFEVLIVHVIKVIREQLNNLLEDNIHDTLDKYAQKCIRVCWFMCITDPPMYLDFGGNQLEVTQCDVANDLLLRFDASKFVNYSKQGMFMKFVVWPALYLYKDGPLMKKGIAQGSN